MSNGLEIPLYPCELCDSMEGKRREDNIAVCDECDKEHPYEEE